MFLIYKIGLVIIILQVVKRNGSLQDFDKNKIYNAIIKSMSNGGKLYKHQANNIANFISNKYKNHDTIDISVIESDIFHQLIACGNEISAKSYEGYRKIREFQRDKMGTTDKQISELLSGTSEYWNEENSNKDAKVVTTLRDYMAGIISTDMCRKYMFSPEIVQAHDSGIIHIHDMDYRIMPITNCCLINLEDMLQNGTVINGVRIDKPHRLSTATTIATQVITSVTSCQYGGTTITLTHLAPFVRDSYNLYLNKYKEYGLSDRDAKNLANLDLKKEISDSVQTFNYQINSMNTTNGQSPFLTVFMYVNENKEYANETAMLIEEFLRQRIIGMKNKVGVYVTPAFPKLIYCLDETNTNDGDKYYYLTVLSAKCTAKRMVPDYVSAKKLYEMKGAVYPSMGCRSHLTTDRTTENYANANNWVKGNKYYGRANSGVVTLNLVDVALSSAKDIDMFWELMDIRTELCHSVLKQTNERLSKVTSDVAPILWQYGALARLKSGETLDRLVHNGYMTSSLGYAGLYECVKYITDSSHSTAVGNKFAMQIMTYMNDKCKKWKKEENIDYSIYGSPIESTTYTFAKTLKARFGEIKGITDRNYVTNSYHIPVFEKINPFDKLRIESEFQTLSPGGFISYIESANLNHNIEVILSIIKYIYNTIGYAELNIKSDYCQQCGYDGEITIIDKDGKLVWQCPNCGNEDMTKMNIARRVCGYISTNVFNQGRTQEIRERYVHLDNHEV